jgi:hypothetical protein
MEATLSAKASGSWGMRGMREEFWVVSAECRDVKPSRGTGWWARAAVGQVGIGYRVVRLMRKGGLGGLKGGNRGAGRKGRAWWVRVCIGGEL